LSDRAADTATQSVRWTVPLALAPITLLLLLGARLEWLVRYFRVAVAALALELVVLTGYLALAV
jgi:hypothetical protein